MAADSINIQVNFKSTPGGGGGGGGKEHSIRPGTFFVSESSNKN